MILNLNKDFFLGALIWYIMITAILQIILSIIGAEKETTYSAWDGIVMVVICLGWIIA